MGLYGDELNKFLNEEQIPLVSFEDYMEYATNESYNIEKLFENIDYNILLSEDGAVAALPGPTKANIKETTKAFLKKIKEAIKKIFDKCKEAIITFFTKTLPTQLKKIHESVSLKDSVIKRFSKYMTYENLERCRDFGWKGYSDTTVFVTRYPDVTDTMFGADTNTFLFPKNNSANVQTFQSKIDESIDKMDSFIDEASNAEDKIDDIFQKAEKLFNDTKAIIKEFNGKFIDNMYSKLELSPYDLNYEDSTKGGYLGMFKANTPDGTVMIDSKTFNVSKKCAEDGVKDTRKYVNHGKEVIKEIEKDNKYYKEIMNLTEKDIKDVGDLDTRLLRLQYMKYQLQFEAGKAFITQALIANKKVGQMMLLCNRYACIFYMKTWAIIKKYNKEAKAAAGE
jgi:hypothetical protein